MAETHSARTLLRDGETCGLGSLDLAHPPGTFALTPASRISVRAIGKNQHLLSGSGLDWGSGTGCLAIAAARIAAVQQVIGLELSAADVDIARENARANGVSPGVRFLQADSYLPHAPADRALLETWKEKVDFVLANPPSSEGDDGFEYRRIVLRGARDFLRPGGAVFLSISCQYGAQRSARLRQDAPGFVHNGVLATTPWQPFDLSRPDLLHCLELYAREEERGGLPYAFGGPVDARQALEHFCKTGESPLSQWQTHLFTYQP